MSLINTTVFSHPLIIKEIHLDTFGHVNNATYLTLFEDARWDLMTKNGYGLQKIQETGLGPTVLEIKLIFFKRITFARKRNDSNTNAFLRKKNF